MPFQVFVKQSMVLCGMWRGLTLGTYVLQIMHGLCVSINRNREWALLCKGYLLSTEYWDLFDRYYKGGASVAEWDG